MIRAVVFDLGGTLVDFHSGAADWRSMEARGVVRLIRFLAERGWSPPEREFSAALWDALQQGWEQAMAGRGNVRLIDVIATTTAGFGISLGQDDQLQATRVYMAGVGEGAAPHDDANQVLSTIKRRGLQLGLLSNTIWPGQFHREDMQAWGLLEFFDVTMFSSDTGLWKPNAAAFRYVIDRLDVSPEEAIFVGDLPAIDIGGAQRAGLRAVWIATDGIELGDVRPEAVIRCLAELPAVLDQLDRGGRVDR